MIEDILPGNVWWNILNFLEAHELISLIYVSKHLRQLVLIKFDKYYKSSTGFVLLDNGKENYVTIHLIF